MKEKLLTTLFILFISTNLKAQYVFEGTNLRATLNNAGDLFYDPNTFFPGFEIPKNSGLHTVYIGQFWIGGIDSATGNLAVSAQTYRQIINTWYGGPISNVYTGFYDSVYHATQQEVNDHLANFNNPGYQPPQNFLSWPARGIVPNGEPSNMAPFVDHNLDGFYNPMDGDHPKVRGGGAAAYMIFNDARDTFPPQGTPCCLGVDVHQYVYDLSGINSDLENTLFMNYKVVNRSSNNYEDVFFGLWLDGDIGNWTDDFIGCDTSQNIFFTYNADNMDEGPYGYGQNPPAQGTIFLSHPLSRFMTYNNTADSINGNPSTDSDFYNYMRANWRDGRSVTLGGNGMDTSSSAVNHIYSGNGWTEEAVGNPPGDRRMLGTVGPLNLKAGDSTCLDIAMLFFRDNQNNLLNRDSLIRHAAVVQNFYDTHTLSCFDPFSLPILLGLPGTDPEIKIFPNPASESLNILLGFEGVPFRIEIFNTKGELVRDLQGNEELVQVDISDIPKGLYMLKVRIGSTLVTQKFVKN